MGAGHGRVMKGRQEQPISHVSLKWYHILARLPSLADHATLNFKIASQPSRQHLFFNSIPFSIGFNLQMISFESATF
jgi:hypothetical protein